MKKLIEESEEKIDKNQFVGALSIYIYDKTKSNDSFPAIVHFNKMKFYSI